MTRARTDRGRATRARVAVAIAVSIIVAWPARATADAPRTTRASLDDGATPNARGGTELMSRALARRAPRALLDRVHVIKSRVRETSAEASRPNVLWLHDLPGDPESAHLADAASRARFRAFVFVSEWQRRAYEGYFGDVFGDKATVLRNAIEPFGRRESGGGEGSVVRLIYHTTPHRGLDVLLAAFARLYDELDGALRLDVYSSFAIYGWDHRDAPFESLFDVCRRHPGCEYHGAVSNEEVRKALAKAHIFAYPSTWMETSCVAAIEALSAGVHVVTSSLGALPETLNGFATMYEYTEDKQKHFEAFGKALSQAISEYWQPQKVHMRRVQQVYASQIFGWGTAGFSGRADDWVRFLGSIHDTFNGVRPLERGDFDSDSEFSEALFVAGRVQEARGDTRRALELYAKSLEFNSLNSFTLISMGTLEMSFGEGVRDFQQMHRGVERLEFAVDNADGLSPPLDPNSAAYYGAAVRSGYYRETRSQKARAVISFDKALNTTRNGEDDCWEVYRATMVPHFPLTPEEERDTIASFNERVDALMNRDALFCRGSMALANPFSIAYYFDGVDYKKEYSKWVLLKAKLYPDLQYVSPDLVYETTDAYLKGEQSAKIQKMMKKRKIKLGVVSSFFKLDSSIWGNFGHIVRGLQQDPRLEVDMIYYPREPIEPLDAQLSVRPESNIYLKSRKSDDAVLIENRKQIESRKFDVLLYLDLFMTGEMHDYAMAKLAPVQIVTHGHPVTSGIPQHIMDYFLSWELAELPDKERAQEFYTEKLLLVNSKNKAWEYFVPRTKDEVSIIKGPMDFSHYTRENIDFIPEMEKRKLSVPGATWYFCPQAAFKYHVTFDRLLGRIQKKDPKAVIILMQLVDAELAALHAKVIQRLQEQGGVDLERVVFIPRMKHYQLMAMYKLSDVVLDSVYFGGDTTTREAFEVGSPVVTLPGKTIGQRWTQAYYKVMGIGKFIARDEDDYVSIATATANAKEATKRSTRESIKTAVHEKLFGNSDAHKLWADAIVGAVRRPTRWHWRDAAAHEKRDEL